jgi:hypothetical protein
MRETDLYEPLRKYFIGQGYTVHSEVKNCDLVAKKADEVVIVELKTGFSLSLVYQAIRRQEIGDSVYVAVPVPVGKNNPPNLSSMKHLLRRLELGLILVRFMKTKTKVEIALHPREPVRRRARRARAAVIREIDGRYAEFDSAGAPSAGGRMSSYRQESLLIASLLERQGPLSPKTLREKGTSEKTGRILSANIYGWFVRIDRGVYAINDAGREALRNHTSEVKEILRGCSKR